MPSSISYMYMHAAQPTAVTSPTLVYGLWIQRVMGRPTLWAYSVDRSKRQVPSRCHVSLVYLFSVAFSFDGSAIMDRCVKCQLTGPNSRNQGVAVALQFTSHRTRNNN